ncbi:protein kinase domain-containing protein [Acetobacterium sp.]|uniref:protein kinase domain-containing protein n=1 Tax=Acetobacterium sp. TaxID=1872094 RepID=UPI002F425E56
MSGRITTIKGFLPMFGYGFVDILGKGDFGTCYEITQNGEAFVFKVFNQNDVKRRKSKLSLEAKLLREVRHPGIPRLLKVIDQDGVYGFVMEKKPGDTLEDTLTWGVAFSKTEIIGIISQLIEITGVIQESGICHCDINPRNILWDHGIISLIDFGSARRKSSRCLRFNQDFWGIGDVFMRLGIASRSLSTNPEDLSIDGLILSQEEKKVIKRLLAIESPYKEIRALSHDFKLSFIQNKNAVTNFNEFI